MSTDALSPLSATRIKAARVLVVGDVMLDRYWHGAVDRISPKNERSLALSFSEIPLALFPKY